MLLEVDAGSRRQRQPLDSSKVLPSSELLSVDGMSLNQLRVAPQPDLIGSKSSATATKPKNAPISHPLLPPEVQGVTPVTDDEINENDVLCGRGGDINSHAGNEQFRSLVESKKNIYLTARFKREKRLIAASVVDEIHRMKPPGRFLSKIQIPGKRRGRRNKGPELGWYEIEDDKAREKASQALRENAPALRKELQQKQVSQRSLGTDDPDSDMEMDQAEDRAAPGDKRSLDHVLSRAPPLGHSNNNFSQISHHQQWNAPPQQEHSQVLVPMAAYRNNSSSFMWDSIKSAGEAVTSIVSTCVGDLSQTNDELLTLPAPDETRMVIDNDANRRQKHEYGTIGYMAAAASSMVNACLGGDEDEGQTDIEPLALPAPSASMPSVSRSRGGMQKKPPPLEIRRGSFENYTNRSRRMRPPADATAAFSPIRLNHEESGLHGETHDAHTQGNLSQQAMNNDRQFGDQTMRPTRHWAPAPPEPQAMDFEEWMQHGGSTDRPDHQYSNANVTSNKAAFHPGFGRNEMPTQQNTLPAFPDPPVQNCSNDQPNIHQPNMYYDQDTQQNKPPSQQPYLSEKTTTDDSWLGPIASKSSDFSEMDMHLEEGFLNLSSFDSPDSPGATRRRPSWEKPQAPEQREYTF
jgi:hypothetical protein